ncbi:MULTISPECIES: FKBP-type peptidyl-prolyl cis-trans isomerase [Protofrankia]|uniref:Peptidyl-prolyl cis-trans isomerase n=1 Tax=Candidatus Protofrankia datiscae TaxID=2716812 RepID=F8AZ26_9ACTN|nr:MULTISPECIES: FKBP-type peptidyl-prolyl cis-trans isomerase [Protofrankia]AEH09622.1 peptidylprolyl isomerase FKBP-type [Candidatus Protofrankia datiscae]
MTVVPRLGRGVRFVILSAVLLAALPVTLAACGSSTAPDGTGDSQLPTVTGAGDLSAKPTIAAGAGTPPATLVTRDLVVGTGAVASPTSTVSVQYVGTLWANGKEFDASWDRGQPSIFPLDGVIPGFQQGIAGMKTGGRRTLVIPPELGYGAADQGPIPGGSTLVFVVDLVGVQASDH